MTAPETQSDARVEEAAAAQLTLHEIQRRLDRLERREWFTWWSVVVIMLLLVAAVVTASYPDLIKEGSLLNQFQTSQALRGLICVVLLFNIYAIWQHKQIRELRQELNRKVEDISKLQLEADEFFKLAVMDHLTGLFNRRFADERLATELGRARRHKHALTVVTLDLDDFKSINDQHGHAAGDLVLRHLADKMKKAVRTTDIVARLGGDEFLAILLECPLENSAVFLNRLRPLEVPVDATTTLQIKISAGSAAYQEGDTAEKMLERADRALYASKRNRKPGPTG